MQLPIYLPYDFMHTYIHLARMLDSLINVVVYDWCLNIYIYKGC